MTKKDFELIASILKTYNESVKMGWAYEIENAFADMLAKKYPKFQKDKFLKTCGVEVRKKSNEMFECQQCGEIIPIYRDLQDRIILEDCPFCK